MPNPDFIADTEEMRKVATKLEKELETYNQEVGRIYNEINNLRSAWQGPTSTLFIRNCEGKKPDLEKIGLKISEFREEISRKADETDEKVGGFRSLLR